MNNLPSLCLSPAQEVLKHKIRYAVEPDNPMLVKLWLGTDLEESLSHSLMRRQYLSQFNLLLETVLDELIPTHWRRICLDNIYLPLCGLKKLVNDDDSEKQLQNLFNELAISTRYVERSLSSN